VKRAPSRKKEDARVSAQQQHVIKKRRGRKKRERGNGYQDFKAAARPRGRTGASRRKTLWDLPKDVNRLLGKRIATTIGTSIKGPHPQQPTPLLKGPRGSGNPKKGARGGREQKQAFSSMGIQRTDRSRDSTGWSFRCNRRGKSLTRGSRGSQEGRKKEIISFPVERRD